MVGTGIIIVQKSLSTDGQASEAETDSNMFDYALGRGSDAFFRCDGYGGTSLGDRVYLVRDDRPGIYVNVELQHDLPTTMHSVLGHAMLAPPQIGMRGGQEVAATIDAMGLGLISGLTPVGFQTGKDTAGRPTEQIEFHGIQGSIIAHFSTESALLFSLEATIGDTGFSLIFSGEKIVAPGGVVVFDAGDRDSVSSFSEGTGGPAMVGEPAPDFTLETLDGSHRSIEAARGGTLVIDFWALWCNPCVQAMPRLDVVARRLAALAEPVTVWTLLIVEGNDESRILDRVRTMWADGELTLPVLIDRDAVVSESYGVKALPTTLVIDEKGVVEHIESGLDPIKLEQLLASSKRS
jgi:thiol-disulfide isomerase/thioredoxin